MAYTLIGHSLVDRVTYATSGYTFIVKANNGVSVAAVTRGIMKLWGAYMVNAGTVKIKVFRDDGTNYLFIGEQAATLVLGLNENLPCFIPVEKGDFLGFYSAANNIEAQTVLAGDWVYRGGDITTDSLKSTWTTGDLVISLQGKIFSRVGIL